MKVYFTGAHATGKTTLCRYVSEKYKIPMLPELARIILAEWELNIDSLRINLDTVDKYQEEIISRQFIEEKKHKDFVSDRSFDGLAYAAQHSRMLGKLLQREDLQNYVEKLKDDNTFIFFVRPSRATMKQDGVRETLNWEGIIQIDAMCKFMIEMWGLKYYQINMDSIQERIRFIDSILRKC